MKVTKLKVDRLLYLLNRLRESGIEYVDAEVILSKNTLKLNPSKIEVKELLNFVG